jgi:transcriptional regulator with XRE-family HTH domain
MRTWHRERAIFETTERLCELMEELKVSRSELARRLGTTPGYVTQLLDGTTNMTIAKASDVFLALGREFHPADTQIQSLEDRPMILSAHGWWGSQPGEWKANLSRLG